MLIVVSSIYRGIGIISTTWIITKQRSALNISPFKHWLRALIYLFWNFFWVKWTWTVPFTPPDTPLMISAWSCDICPCRAATSASRPVRRTDRLRPSAGRPDFTATPVNFLRLNLLREALTAAHLVLAHFSFNVFLDFATRPLTSPMSSRREGQWQQLWRLEW